MPRTFSGFTFIMVLLGLTGCAGLGNMKTVQFENNIAPEMTMVNIVRRSLNKMVRLTLYQLDLRQTNTRGES